MDKRVVVKRKTLHVEVTRGALARLVLKVPTFAPLLMVAPAVILGAGSKLSDGEADTLGTGSEILLILTLLISPLVALTGWRWIIPMRRWYGVMFGVTALADAATAAIVTTNFEGGIIGRLTGHTFLFVGLVMTALLIPLTATGNNRAQRALGRHWKTLHKITYVIWGLLLLHLALLEGFGVERGDRMGLLHQRFWQLFACSVFLLVMRLPVVKRRGVNPLLLGAMIGLFLIGYIGIEHEFLFKGIDMIRLQPSAD